MMTIRRAPILLLRVVLWCGLLASICYAVSILVAFVQDFALPTSAIFSWSETIRRLGEHDHYIAHLLLVAVTLCTIAEWISAIGSPSSQTSDIERLSSFWRAWGLPMTAALFVFSLSGTWAGLPRSGDFNAASIGGLIPFSDANGYFAGAYDQARDGAWNTISLRRPLAAAFRSVFLAAGGFSYARMLLIQTLLCALSAWIAARSLLTWRGPFASIAFVALSFMICRSFMATALTEPLGLIWSFLSVACFVESLGRRSVEFALLGLAFTFMSLMTRMGAMFLLPAVALWILLCFGSDWWQKLKIAMAVCGVLIAGFITIASLQKMYGEGENLSGSNFAYTLCGLSVGDDWSSCPRLYASDVKEMHDEKALTDFLYFKAIQNIRQDPSKLVHRLVEAGRSFARSVTPTILNGYLQAPPSRWLRTGFFLWVSLFGLIVLALCGPAIADVVFWSFSLIAILVSGAVVFFDDGMRVMCGSYPLLAAMVVCGLFTPGMHAKPSSNRRGGPWWTSLVVTILVFLIAPWLIHWSAPRPASAATIQDQQRVFGGKRMSGFLVVADNEPLRTDVPSLHLSDFAKLIDLSGDEIYQPLLKGRHPDLPFGFVAAPRRETGLPSNNQFIVPAHVMLDKKAQAWKFTTAEWSHTEGNGIYWLLVVKAEPEDISAP